MSSSMAAVNSTSSAAAAAAMPDLPPALKDRSAAAPVPLG